MAFPFSRPIKLTLATLLGIGELQRSFFVKIPLIALGLHRTANVQILKAESVFRHLVTRPKLIHDFNRSIYIPVRGLVSSGYVVFFWWEMFKIANPNLNDASIKACFTDVGFGVMALGSLWYLVPYATQTSTDLGFGINISHSVVNALRNADAFETHKELALLPPRLCNSLYRNSIYGVSLFNSATSRQMHWSLTVRHFLIKGMTLGVWGHRIFLMLGGNNIQLALPLIYLSSAIAGGLNGLAKSHEVIEYFKEHRKDLGQNITRYNLCNLLLCKPDDRAAQALNEIFDPAASNAF